MEQRFQKTLSQPFSDNSLFRHGVSIMLITSPHYNRPSCSKLFVEYLSRCYNIGGVEVVFVVEPGNDEVLSIVENSNLPNYDVIKNDRLLGLWETKKKCLQIGFERSDFVIHLEDDLLVAKDTLLFYEWCYKSYAGTDSVFSVNGFNQIPPFNFLSMGCPSCGTLPYSQVRLRQGFNSIGMSFWKNRYERFVDKWDGSDTYIESFRLGLRHREAFPVLSRINHIGFTQGESYTKELLEQVVNLGHKPIGLKDVETLTMEDDVKLLHNVENREWVKINDSKVRSRCKESFYKQHYYLDMWAGNMDYELTQFKAF